LSEIYHEKNIDNTTKDLISSIFIYLSEELKENKEEDIQNILYTLKKRIKEKEINQSEEKRTIIILVESLSTETVRNEIQELMIKTTGNISCSISVPNRTITLYTKNNAKKIIKILENEEYKGKVISEEIIEKKNTIGDDDEDKENKPKYLEKQTQEIKKENLNRALLLSNQGDNLQSRIEKKKKEEETSFLGKITSIFW
jgi:hypothetical protein